MTTDAVLQRDVTSGLYDISLDENGDIKSEDFFDTSILYSIFGERRASADEVTPPELRRGWIGNADDFENGSKVWLFSQARVTRSNLNRIQDEIAKSLQWLVDDGFAVAIDSITAQFLGNKVTVEVAIRRSGDKIDRKLYTLWENTGRDN